MIAVAEATCTNFDPPLGPSVHSAWIGLAPPPEPKPDVDQALDNKLDENWDPCPRKGECIGGERIGKTYVPWMSDFIHSMSNALLRSGGLYDVHVLQEKVKQYAKEYRVNFVPTDSFAEVRNSPTLALSGLY